MRVVHVLRKPVSEASVSANVVEHGTGGIHINATRIGTLDSFGGGSRMSSSGQTLHSFEHYEKGSGGVPGSQLGHWPSNLILQHQPGCEVVGTKRVKSGNPCNKVTAGGASTGACYGDYGQRSLVGHADAEGKETVPDWACAPGCPVAALDEQSGILKSGVMDSITQGGQGNVYGKMYPRRAVSYGSEGGASRFYKQVGGKK